MDIINSSAKLYTPFKQICIRHLPGDGDVLFGFCVRERYDVASSAVDMCDKCNVPICKWFS